MVDLMTLSEHKHLVCIHDMLLLIKAERKIHRISSLTTTINARLI